MQCSGPTSLASRRVCPSGHALLKLLVKAVSALLTPRAKQLLHLHLFGLQLAARHLHAIKFSDFFFFATPFTTAGECPGRGGAPNYVHLGRGSACPTAGVLGPRGAPLERAAARVYREAGARVANNVLLRDMNLDVPLADARRIEVLANGLPLYQGAQVAVDTTLVSPVSRDGSRLVRARADRKPGAAASDAARNLLGALGGPPLKAGRRWAGGGREAHGGDGHIPPLARRCPCPCGPNTLATRHAPG